MMRISRWLPGLSSLLLLGACLDIERTEVSSTGGAGGMQTGNGAENAGGVPADFMPTPCVQECVDKTPAGTRNFALVATCTETARVNDCAQACENPGSVPAGTPTCSVPGSVDADPGCSFCLKESCCPALSRCFGDIACITIGICASGCDG
ncbi:MAG TPA: hypothetical protein VG937_16260 [Polyangiaceae bacterium]|nr:hypothetical protein [Polyangiaceae bacterium]